jgi:hypothetical protein
MEEIKYIANLDEMEDQCIAIRIHSVIIYCYPICEKVLEYHPKVLTRSGKVVKKVQMAMRGCDDLVEKEKVITGLLDDERLVWDEQGRYNGEDDNELNLYVPEKYWDKDWKSKIKLSNSAWALKYQRRHPTAKVPENRQRYYRGVL